MQYYFPIQIVLHNWSTSVIAFSMYKYLFIKTVWQYTVIQIYVNLIYTWFHFCTNCFLRKDQIMVNFINILSSWTKISFTLISTAQNCTNVYQCGVPGAKTSVIIKYMIDKNPILSLKVVSNIHHDWACNGRFLCQIKHNQRLLELCLQF